MSVVINIEEAKSEEEYGRACVCRVPKSLSSGKPEAFTPQFVGLGPYHHFSGSSKLAMTEDLKFGAARRVFKHAFQFRISDIHLFYQADAFGPMGFTQANIQSHAQALGLDAFFLLALLHWSTGAEQHYNFLTGKHGLPLVNAVGVELTMDAVIRDVFMLENQIPTYILHQLMICCNLQEIQPQQDLGAKMLSFCQKHCPLVNFEKLSKEPQEYDHLLDLMYHFVQQPNSEDSRNRQHTNNNAQSKSNNNGTLIYHLLGFISPLFESSQDDHNNNSNTCCSGFFTICRGILGFFLLFICLVIYLVWELIRHINPAALFMRALHYIYDLLKYASSLIQPIVDSLYSSLSNRESQNPVLKSFTLVLGGVKRASEEILRDTNDPDKDVRSVATIPSVTELHKAGIGFQPTKLGGIISGIEFDEGTCMFSLPSIKVDVNSEVIMRNLVAYESLIDSKRPLVFTRYVEIMRAIIDTREDVKLLVEREIIQTQLSDQFVADVFNGMSKSIRPTNTPDLEKEIKKVDAKYEDSQKVKRALVKYVYSAGKFYTVVAALLFLALTAVQAYCSVYSCARTASSGWESQ